MNSLYRTGSYLGFFFVVLAWADSPVKIRKILSLLLYSTIITAVFAICQEVMGGIPPCGCTLIHQSISIRSGMGEPHRSELFKLPRRLSQPDSPFCSACYVRGQGKWKTLGAWTLGLGFLAMLTTQSVGGLVAFVAILILGFSVSRESHEKPCSFCQHLRLCRPVVSIKTVLESDHTEESIGPDTVMRVLLWGTAWVISCTRQ